MSASPHSPGGPTGYLALVLHAHLPFVRHPEHDHFLEENWLFEAMTESYLPLIQLLRGWERAAMRTRLTLTLTPPLCAMLGDPLLQGRYRAYLANLLELAHKEVHRTRWENAFHELAVFYESRFARAQEAFEASGGNLLEAFRELQDHGLIEIITSAATHGLLPLLARHPPSVRAQILIARDDYRRCFGREPRGIWLPECAYVETLEPVLREAGLRWFVVESHGLLHARPRPRYGVFAPVLTATGLAAFGRDVASAHQVWSRQGGYPGDPRYRDFYRDIGFDLDWDYLRPHLAGAQRRTFTGIKYYGITGDGPAKRPYNRAAAVQAADAHASHFLRERVAQVQRLGHALGRPPILVCPYDAELFGHWWFEGPEFLDFLVRKAYYDQNVFRLVTPGDYLREQPTQQMAQPAASSWGEEGYWRVWLNEKNQWAYPHLAMAQDRMSELARRFPVPSGLQSRALEQAARELLLAQASDWPFILRSGTSPDYARLRLKNHLLRFTRLYDQLRDSGVDQAGLAELERRDNIFPEINFRYYAQW